MELLSKIKELYEVLLEAKTVSEIPTLEDIEKLAEEVYKEQYQRIDSFLVPILSTEQYAKVGELIKEIKECAKN